MTASYFILNLLHVWILLWLSENFRDESLTARFQLSFENQLHLQWDVCFNTMHPGPIIQSPAAGS